MLRNVFVSGLLTLALAASAFVIACSDDDSGDSNGSSTPSTPAEQSVQSIIDAFNNGDIQTFLAGWTDEGLQEEFGATREELMAAADQFFGGPERELRSVNTSDSDSDTATVDAEFAVGKSVSKERLVLVNENGEWRIESTEPLPPDLASGVETVDVQLDEFAFGYDASEAESGNIAFKAENVGDQAHEMALIKIPESANVQELLQQAATSPDLPEGVEVIGGIPPIVPGSEGWLAFTGRLDSGRYVMACFLPDTSDPQLTPHVSKGMLSEFNVATAGGGP
jgi:hypothetical protein